MAGASSRSPAGSGSPRRGHCSASSSCRLKPRRDQLGWLGLGLALVAYGVLAAGYATLTPIWQNPDEPAHYNYIAFVADTGGLPELKPGDWDSALLERLKNGTLHRFVNIYVNDEDVRFTGGLETTVAEGDAVTILPAVAGGSSR